MPDCFPAQETEEKEASASDDRSDLPSAGAGLLFCVTGKIRRHGGVRGGDNLWCHALVTWRFY
ncbi:hypothetical protein [Bilifractor porci]|uniref:Uncharacterized protein n=1 Tax=Bilifractor porci TaxID=2606636 RepID=A0A7X2TNC6_9FIRM|nr:hypothetical protein [Bilifractor porci]MST82164.1 hypothetical protein [Bilifractor porci]